jgi:hypothetical protein
MKHKPARLKKPSRNHSVAELLHIVARKRRAHERGYQPNTFRVLEYPKYYAHRLRHRNFLNKFLGKYKP